MEATMPIDTTSIYCNDRGDAAPLSAQQLHSAIADISKALSEALRDDRGTATMYLRRAESFLKPVTQPESPAAVKPGPRLAAWQVRRLAVLGLPVVFVLDEPAVSLGALGRDLPCRLSFGAAALDRRGVPGCGMDRALCVVGPRGRKWRTAAQRLSQGIAQTAQKTRGKAARGIRRV